MVHVETSVSPARRWALSVSDLQVYMSNQCKSAEYQYFDVLHALFCASLSASTVQRKRITVT